MENNELRLRAVEPSDVEVLYSWENDMNLWEVSQTTVPFSKHILSQYVDSIQDIYSDKQLRLIIESKLDGSPLGCVDLFDFDPVNLRAGVGILIGHPSDRKKGFAKSALSLIIPYAKDVLRLNQLFCNITTDNSDSIRLFSQAGFELGGVKKQWIRSGDSFKDEGFYQLML